MNADQNQKRKFLSYSLLILISIMLIVSIVPHFVSAAEWIPGSGIKSFFEGFFKGWKSGHGFSDSVTKLLLTVILTIVIQGLLSFVPGLNKRKGIFLWIVAIIVAFLAMAYITPAELIIMMSSYTGMGFVIGMAIPFLILLAFTFEVGKNLMDNIEPENVTAAVVQAWFGRIAWGLYAIIMIYHTIQAFSLKKSGSPNVSGIGFWGVIILAGLAVVIFFFYKPILKKFESMANQALRQRIANIRRKSKGRLKQGANFLGDAADAAEEQAEAEKRRGSGPIPWTG